MQDHDHDHDEDDGRAEGLLLEQFRQIRANWRAAMDRDDGDARKAVMRASLTFGHRVMLLSVCMPPDRAMSLELPAEVWAEVAMLESEGYRKLVQARRARPERTWRPVGAASGAARRPGRGVEP